MQHYATLCNGYCNTMQRILQRSATHCNTILRVMSCNFCQRNDFQSATARRSHQSRCARNPKNIVQPIQEAEQQQQQPALQDFGNHDEVRVQFDADDTQQEAADSDSDYVDEPEELEKQAHVEQLQQQVPQQQQQQQQLPRFDLRAIESAVPAVQTVVKRRGKKGKIESLCDEVVKLANSMRSNTTSDEVFNNILVTVLTEKVVSSKLDRSTVDRMIEFLTSTTEEQTLNFQQAKINLRKEYVDHAFSENQRKVIDDLANLEVNRTTCNDQIDFALYYEKYVKMMLKYHFASNNRSRYAVKMVINVLSEQHYDAVGLATKIPDTYDRKARIKAVLIHIGVFCCAVFIVSMLLLWWVLPSNTCPDYVQSANMTVCTNSTVSSIV